GSGRPGRRGGALRPGGRRADRLHRLRREHRHLGAGRDSERRDAEVALALMLEVGDRFPVEKLSVQPGGPTVVYFYPADLTPGCTLEAKGFNVRYDRFREAGYEVIGVSLDTDERHDEFRAECGLAFPLVSDEGGTLTEELDLLKDYGDNGLLTRRVTCL